jgi:hypothetical protein
LGSYLNREQYGKTPLFYGPAYCSEIDRVAERLRVLAKASEQVLLPLHPRNKSGLNVKEA